MRKLFLLLAMIGILTVACQGGLDNDGNSQIKLPYKTIDVGFAPSSYQVMVTSPYSWDAVSKNSWIVIETETGIAGTKELSFRVEYNAAKKVREGTILLTNSAYGLAAELYVIQKGLSDEEYAERVLLYTSSDNAVITPSQIDIFGANIVSNIYENDMGVIMFDAPITLIGAKAFSGCSSLTSVTIPDSVTSIGDRAFSSCSSLTSVTIPDSITSIGNYAFQNCDSLTSIIIPDSVTSIGNYAFQNCNSLTSIIIPDSVTSIGDRAFSSCSSLTSVIIPNSVTSIGNYAFQNCDSLTSIIIPDGVTSIGNSTFSSCDSLTSVTIGNSVTSIGNSTFYSCSSLRSVTIGNSVTSIGNNAFKNCSSLTSVTIPESVTSIGETAFAACVGELIINSKIVEKNYEKAYNCNDWLDDAEFTKLTIGDNITNIGNYAFQYCSSLTSVTIPDSVTSIGIGAFSNCSSLTSVYCKPSTPPTGESNMFSNNASGRKIYVPRNSVDAYKSASYWSSYKSYIVGYDF